MAVASSISLKRGTHPGAPSSAFSRVFVSSENARLCIKSSIDNGGVARELAHLEDLEEIRDETAPSGVPREGMEDDFIASGVSGRSIYNNAGRQYFTGVRGQDVSFTDEDLSSNDLLQYMMKILSMCSLTLEFSEEDVEMDYNYNFFQCPAAGALDSRRINFEGINLQYPITFFLVAPKGSGDPLVLYNNSSSSPVTELPDSANIQVFAMLRPTPGAGSMGQPNWILKLGDII
jgi:hypothetical protein